MAKKRSVKGKRGNKILLAGLAAAGLAAGYLFYGDKASTRRAQVKAWMFKAKADVLERVEKIKHVDEQTYSAVVDNVMRRYETLKHIDKKDAEKLRGQLGSLWKNIERELKKRTSRTKKNRGGASRL